MPAPYTKQQLLDLVDTYIPETVAPNIRATEHRDLETKILDRTDARILHTRVITVTNLNGYQAINITVSPSLYTSNYIVVLTPYTFSSNTNPKILSYRTTYAITNRTQTGFTIQLYGNTTGYIGAYTGKFSVMVINKDPL